MVREMQVQSSLVVGATLSHRGPRDQRMRIVIVSNAIEIVDIHDCQEEVLLRGGPVRKSFW